MNKVLIVAMLFFTKLTGQALLQYSEVMSSVLSSAVMVLVALSHATPSETITPSMVLSKSNRTISLSYFFVTPFIRLHIKK